MRLGQVILQQERVRHGEKFPKTNVLTIKSAGNYNCWGLSNYIMHMYNWILGTCVGMTLQKSLEKLVTNQMLLGWSGVRVLKVILLKSKNLSRKYYTYK